MRPRAAGRVVGIVVVLLAVAAGCQNGVWTGPPEGAAVAVIGDSILYHAEGNFDSPVTHRDLVDELVASGYRANVASYIGETMQLGYERLWPKVSAEPDLDTLVIALGTNDVARDIPLETTRLVLRQWLVEAASVRCVALIGVNELATGWRLDRFGPAFNQMLAEEATRHPNASYVEWRPDLAIHGYSGDVHLSTPAAQAQYRTTIHGAVDDCRPDGSTTTTTTEPPTTTTTQPEPTTTTTQPEPTTTTTEPEPTTTTEPESTTTTTEPGSTTTTTTTDPDPTTTTTGPGSTTTTTTTEPDPTTTTTAPESTTTTTEPESTTTTTEPESTTTTTTEPGSTTTTTTEPGSTTTTTAPDEDPASTTTTTTEVPAAAAVVRGLAGAIGRAVAASLVR